MLRATSITTAMALACLAPSTAYGQGSPAEIERIQVKYRVAPDCPDRAAFIDQVRARTAKAEVVEGPTTRVFWVEIDHATDGLRGRLLIQEESFSVREVEGATCSEVVAALGLITALAVDPKALTSPAPPPPPPPPIAPDPGEPPFVFTPAPPTLTDAPARSAGGLGPYIPRPPPRLTYAGGPWPPEADPLPVLPSPGQRSPWVVGAGAHGGAVSAISPTLSPYVSGFGELAYEGRRPWQPVLRLGGVFAPAPDTETSGGTLALSLLAAQLEGCPARFYLGSDIFSASPCVAVEAGALMVTGTSATETVDRTRPWVAGRAIVRLSARVAHAVTLEAQGGLVAPFVHDEFVFEPNTTAHEVPPLGGTFGGGVAFRIW